MLEQKLIGGQQIPGLGLRTFQIIASVFHFWIRYMIHLLLPHTMTFPKN